MTTAIEHIAQQIELARTNVAALYMPADGMSEEYLAQRFSRLARAPRKIVYEITSDVGLLHQYHLLREEMFFSVWGYDGACARQDDCDNHSEIMVARVGNHCVGGCRVTFSTPGARTPLPMELDGFSLAAQFPNLDDAVYAEISCMAILPGFENSMSELSRRLLERAAQMNARYAFAVVSLPQLRDFNKAASVMGLKWLIQSDVVVSKDETTKVLAMLDLSTVSGTKQGAKVAADTTLVGA